MKHIAAITGIFVGLVMPSPAGAEKHAPKMAPAEAALRALARSQKLDFAVDSRLIAGVEIPDLDYASFDDPALTAVAASNPTRTIGQCLLESPAAIPYPIP